MRRWRRAAAPRCSWRAESTALGPGAGPPTTPSGAPQGHGKGLGRALLAELMAQAQAVGLRKLIAVIGDSRNAGSIGLHRAVGFTDVGILKSCGWKFDQWLDVVLMECALGQGDAVDPPLAQV